MAPSPALLTNQVPTSRANHGHESKTRTIQNFGSRLLSIFNPPFGGTIETTMASTMAADDAADGDAANDTPANDNFDSAIKMPAPAADNDTPANDNFDISIKTPARPTNNDLPRQSKRNRLQ